MSKDKAEQAAGGYWIIFGESKDGLRVDVSDGQDDIVRNISRERALRLIAIRDTFMFALNAELADVPARLIR